MPDGGSVSKKRCLGLCCRNRGGGAKSVLGRSCVPQGLALAHGNFPAPLALGQKLRQKGYPMGFQEQENGRAAKKEQALFLALLEGTGAVVVLNAAHQQGALTIAVVTRPFSFEGPQRSASAALGIENLRKEVDALIVIPNDRLLELSDRTIGIVDAFKTADTALLAGVQGITDLISSNSYIHVDFNDVNAILRGAGTALFGIGSARGEDRATQAAEIAISSPLLEESIEGAHGALINIAGPTDLKLQEAAAAVALVQKAIHPEAQIIWGLSLDDAYGDEVRVTVIAAGFDANSKKPDQPAEEKPAAAKENTVPLSALSAGVQAPAQQPQPVQTPAVPQVQPLSSYIPSTPDQSVASFDQTTEHEVVSANDPGDLDIPDFLR